MLILTRSEVAALLPMEQALIAVREALAAYSSGAADVPLRAHLAATQPAGDMLVMPAYLSAAPAFGVKIWTQFASSGVGAGAPRAVVYYQDPATDVEALLEGSYLTAVRTGALTGVACQYMAEPAARVLAVIGAGAQAATQIDAVLTVMPIHAVRVWSRDAARRARFVAEAGRRHPGVEIGAATSAEVAVRDADIVVCATTSSSPVIDDAWVANGALVCGIGSHTPDAAEIDPRTVARAALVVVDSRRGALAEAGDLRVPMASGSLAEERIVELGELVLGRVAHRAGARRLAVFKSVGFAALDVAAARLVVQAALAARIGTEVQLR